jgi:hypothetical protein
MIYLKKFKKPVISNDYGGYSFDKLSLDVLIESSTAFKIGNQINGLECNDKWITIT